MTQRQQPITSVRRASSIAVRWTLRVVRVAVAWVLLLVVLAVVATRVRIARASDLGLHFGDELMSVGAHHVDGDVEGAVYDIDVNGQVFHSSNTMSSRSLAELLDYFQDECRHHAGGLRDTFTHLDASVSALTPGKGAEGALVLRRDSGDRGYVFCVAPDHSLSTTEKMARLARLGKTTDLGAMGDMRYVAVRSMSGGTDVVTAWTEGSFAISRMFPVTGDAPGDDFGGVPRPDGARRVFAGTIEKSPFGVNIYEVQGDAPKVLQGLDAKLRGSGWRRLTAGPHLPDSGRFYSLGNSLDLVLSVDPAGTGSTRATYVVSRNVGNISL